MASEDDRNERRVLVGLAIGLVLVGAKVHASHRPKLGVRRPEVVAPAPRADARTSIVIAPGHVTLIGAVRSETERASLLATAKGVFPTFDVTDTLRIDAGEASAIVLRGLLAEAAPLRWGTLSRTARGLVVEGEVALPQDPAPVQEALRRAAGDTTTLEANVTARPAPAAEPHVLEATLGALFAGPIEWPRNDAVLDPSAKAILDPLVPLLTILTGLEVTIEVTPTHEEPVAEWRPEPSGSASLALARAEAIRRHLVERGAAEGRLAVSATHVPPEAPPAKTAHPSPKVRADTRFFVREVRAIK